MLFFVCDTLIGTTTTKSPGDAKFGGNRAIEIGACRESTTEIKEESLTGFGRTTKRTSTLRAVIARTNATTDGFIGQQSALRQA